MTHVEKVPTGIEGLDLISRGGFPRGRTTVFAGSAGTAKTVIACQFLHRGAELGEPGVFVTFEESAADIARNVSAFGWDLQGHVASDRWAFVDASPRPGESVELGPDYDLGGLMSRIEHAVKKVGAKRVAIDSVGAIFSQLTDASIIRRELFAIMWSLREMGVTSLVTVERAEGSEVGRFGVEEFVADNVILLRNRLDSDNRRRTVEILKMRGTDHQKGEYPFTVTSQGVQVIPLSAMQLTQGAANERISTGVSGLDAMSGGGFFRDAMVLAAGPTGTGKTLLVSSFLNAAGPQERCLLFAYEESRDQMFRNALSSGIDLEPLEREGRLKIVAMYPEVAVLEDHLLRIKSEIETFQPDRVAIDSLSALERIGSPKAFREFTVALSSYLRAHGVAALLTTTTPMLGTSATEHEVSTVADAIILLRYVEVQGRMRRALGILKMRGSHNDPDLREYRISGEGMTILDPFRSVRGILGGTTFYPEGAGLDGSSEVATSGMIRFTEGA
ncbi:MAG TPA: circadian clock protein KaiC [Actinomycetota bacterium]|nr:circadian clock protein KaiC [Actinomycetota bacterium]